MAGLCAGRLEFNGHGRAMLIGMAGTSPAMTWRGTCFVAPCVALALSCLFAFRPRLRAGLSQPAGQNRRPVRRRRRHRRAGPVSRARSRAAARPTVHHREPRRLGHDAWRDGRRPLRSRRLHDHVGYRFDLRGRARAVQKAGLRPDQGFLADHAAGDSAVRAHGQSVTRCQQRAGAGRARQAQARRVDLRLCRRRLGAPYLYASS